MDPGADDIENPDPAQALQRARRQAQAAHKDEKKSKNKKGGAILHVNNYRSGIPEAKYKAAKNPNFPTNLKTGYIVKSKGHGNNDQSFVVEAKLGNRVYMVRSTKTEKFSALKIEPFYNDGDVKQLRRDVFILLEAAKQDQRFNHHFLKIVSKGRVPESVNFMVMTLCDFNLDDLRERVLKADFSLPTAARLSMQAFQAVHDLHTLGYLHRNIAPSKFMLGLENNTLIYLGGFSTAFHFKRKDGKESPSPKKLFKLAKTRFLPRAYHRFKEMSRFDDLESWLYTSIDFFGRKLLPWFDHMDESQIVANKERFFFDAFEEIFAYAPKQLQVIQRYIDKNSDDDKPNYTFMGITLVGMRDKLKFPYTGPFDFQNTGFTPSGKSSKHSKKKKKEEAAPAPDGDDPGMPNIAAHTTSKKRTKTPNPPPAPPPGQDDQVFEDGEAEPPAAQDEAPKKEVNVDRALSMARKKKQHQPAAAKAAENDGGGEGNLKPVKPEKITALKKQKPAAAAAPPAPEEDENEEEPAPAAAPPPPPPVARAATPKEAKSKKPAPKKKPAAKKPVKAKPAPAAPAPAAPAPPADGSKMDAPPPEKQNSSDQPKKEGEEGEGEGDEDESKKGAAPGAGEDEGGNGSNKQADEKNE
uniref:Protein kinase domain-containing protein n=1 Tax=Panagrellus redivivus TaxID=6233 RepID=A0A7E4VEA8_PANRE